MTEARSLYDRIGGAPAIEALLGDFYSRVFADPELRPFFEATSVETLERMQRSLFAEALGGPIAYEGKSLAEAHYGRGIQPHHLRRYLGILLDTLKGRGLSEDDVYDIMTRIQKRADDVLGTTGVDG